MKPYIQIILGVGLGYGFFEYNLGAGEVVFIFVGGIAGIAIAYELEQ